MTTRTTTKTISFARPFSLPGVIGPQPAGSYRVDTDEERIDGLSFEAYRRTATLIQRTSSHSTVVLQVDPVELEAALRRDGRPEAP